MRTLLLLSFNIYLFITQGFPKSIEGESRGWRVPPRFRDKTKLKGRSHFWIKWWWLGTGRHNLGKYGKYEIF